MVDVKALFETAYNGLFEEESQDIDHYEIAIWFLMKMDGLEGMGRKGEGTGRPVNHFKPTDILGETEKALKVNLTYEHYEYKARKATWIPKKCVKAVV